jgi:thioredoxin-related protein
MKTFISTILLFTCLPAFCQINFIRKSTWEEAADLARTERKLVFLQLEDNKCQQCNEVASQAFESIDLKELFSKNFISLRASLETDEGKKLGQKFDIKNGPVSLFIDANGNILNRFNGTAGAGFVYAEQADIALKRRSGKQLSDYTKEYNAGARSQKFLEEYIVKRWDAGLPADELLEKYTGGLPLDSLSNFRILKFIYLHGPALDSKVYKAIQAVTPRKIIDSMYRSSPYREAAAMNNAIISTTMQKAVRNKDRELAFQLRYFIQGTYNPDYRKGMIASRRSTLHFYYEIKDTLAYIREATEFLEDIHMRLTADSLKRMDERDMNPPASTTNNNTKQQSRPPMMPQSQFYHMDLNEHAWHVFEMSSKPGDLERALKWSYQSQEFFNSLYKDTAHPMRLGNAAYIDTYAQLLYKLGRKDEAIEWQTKAVEAQKITGSAHASFQETLEKMKDGTLLK